MSHRRLAFIAVDDVASNPILDVCIAKDFFENPLVQVDLVGSKIHSAYAFFAVDRLYLYAAINEKKRIFKIYFFAQIIPTAFQSKESILFHIQRMSIF